MSNGGFVPIFIYIYYLLSFFFLIDISTWCLFYLSIYLFLNGNVYNSFLTTVSSKPGYSINDL